jgi:hypothetical protein
MKRRAWSGLLAALLVSAALLAGCAGSGSRPENTNTPASSGQMSSGAPSTPAAEVSATDAATAPSAGGEGGVSMKVVLADSSGAPVGQAQSPVIDNRKLVYTADVNVEVTDMDAALQKLQNMADFSQGYISHLRKSGTPEKGFTAQVSLRVPTERFEEVMGKVGSELGEVHDANRDVQDVTLQYVDLTARLKSAQEHETRLLALLQKSASLEELLRLESELQRVRSQIESMQGQLNVLNSQIAFSTINVSLVQPAPEKKPEPLVEQKTLGKRIADAWDASVVLMQDIFTGLTVLLVSLALPLGTLGVLVGLVVFVVRRFSRRSRPASPPGE